MSKKKVVVKEEYKWVKRVRPAALALLGSIVLYGTVTAVGIVGIIDNEVKYVEIENDFKNNNQKYREYIEKQNDEIESKYQSEELSFIDFMKTKKEITEREEKNIEHSIAVFASEDTRNEYHNAKDYVTKAKIVTTFGVFGLGGTLIFGVPSIVEDGVIGDKFKIVKKKCKVEPEAEEREM